MKIQELNSPQSFENSGRVGMCLNMCKIPAQDFFANEFGLPLTMIPSKSLSSPFKLRFVHIINWNSGDFEAHTKLCIMFMDLFYYQILKTWVSKWFMDKFHPHLKRIQ